MSIFEWIGMVLLAVIVALLLARAIGRWLLRCVPKGGIHESMYLDINGTRQWISIHGKSRENPVLLYLHGGPGASTSTYDHAFTRPWTDVYTVVTWDQRNCGKSWSEGQWDRSLTYDMMMEDALELIVYLRRHLGKEKVTLLGHSWGTYLGCNLALEYPELIEAYIGVGQLVDFHENEAALKEEAEKWAENDPAGQALIRRLDVRDFSSGHFAARNELLKKYGYDLFANGRDYSLALARLFNPDYSLRDYYRFLRATSRIYRDFICSEEFKRFSLKGRHQYKVPYFNINGDRDYQCNHRLAKEYFGHVEAPYKKLYKMENMTHGLLEARSKEFSKLLHQIAAEMKEL